MIEIIREEDFERTGRKELPKDIKQIGKPDIGERIYVENKVYEFLHPYDSINEKSAYILLGRFENYMGRQCTFVEAAIQLEEMAFDGELPLWSDQTWAYVYRQLRQEHDSMAIVGWALDIKGRLPNLTVRVETLHRNNFGGAHQILFLMDSLEREETFYGSRNGHLYRREGFYIYYDKNISEEINRTLGSSVSEDGEREEREAWDAAGRQEMEMQQDGAGWNPDDGREDGIYVERAERKMGKSRQTESYVEGAGWKKEADCEDGGAAENRGSYRKQMLEREEAKQTPAYTSSLLLLVVVCAFGITAYANYQKMNAMQETLAQMNGTQISGEEIPGTEQTGINVESVAGNISKEGQAETQVEMDGTQGAVLSEQNSRQDEVQTTETGDTATSQSGEGNQSDQDAAQEETPAAPDEGAGSQADAAESGESESAPTMTEAQTYLAQGYYVVQKGDSLVGICKKIYQTTAMMDKLCEVNGIEDENAIYAGQKLMLPN